MTGIHVADRYKTKTKTEMEAISRLAVDSSSLQREDTRWCLSPFLSFLPHQLQLSQMPSVTLSFMFCPPLSLPMRWKPTPLRTSQALIINPETLTPAKWFHVNGARGSRPPLCEPRDVWISQPMDANQLHTSHPYKATHNQPWRICT